MNYTTLELSLRLMGAGRLLPWLGPALRGLTAQQFKDRVCAHAPGERWTRWKKCAGCSYMGACAYGQTFEPDPPAGRSVQKGREDAIRPMVLAPYYPVPELSRLDLAIPLRVVAVGPAVAHVSEMLAALDVAGRRFGLGHDRITFLVEMQNKTEQGELRAEDLPHTPDAISGRLPRVGVGLTAPLFLPRRTAADLYTGGPRLPTFVDLLRAALRSVGELFRLYGEPLRANYAALKSAANPVRLIDHCYEEFDQGTCSSRSGQRYQMQGVIGGGVYSDVPLSLLPWLLWGGRLHSGGRRIAGAGGWRLVLD